MSSNILGVDLFSLMLVGVVLGHAAGLIAWRKRRDGVAFWLWLRDPFYFVRPSYYDTKISAVQLAAGALLLVGAIALILLVVGASRSA